MNCKFTHVDEHGFDWHATNDHTSPAGSQTTPPQEWARPKRSATAAGLPDTTATTSKSSMPTPPWSKRSRSSDVVVIDEAPRASSSSQDHAEPPPFTPVYTPATNRQVYEWLSQERAVKDQKAGLFVRDASQLTTDKGETVYRAAYESFRVHDENGTVVTEFTLGANADICWCTMLYGRGDQLQKHLANALMLGSDLRRKVKPHLSSLGCSFANVLFVTPDALDEYELKAVSWFWSIKIVEVPEVSTSRLRSIAGHLCDENIHAAHVFLKVEAFKIQARISMISDLDMLVLNPDRLAKFLAAFVKNRDIIRQLEECGNVAVMQRISSRVDWHDAFSSRFPPRTANSSSSNFRRHHSHVSYCFGVIKPSAALAQRYMQKMASPGRSGVLSDQDLLAEVLADTYLEVNHNMIMFPSWFNHSNINHIRGREILEAMGWRSFAEVPTDGVTKFIDYFGAVHFSKNFSPCWDKGLDAKLEQMRGAGGRKQDFGYFRGRKLDYESYVQNFLMPLWIELRGRYARKKKELQNEITNNVGSTNPTPGLARATFTLLNYKIAPLAQSGVTLRAHPGRAGDIDDDE